MRLEKIDLNLFIVFDMIYREKSVTKVASLLNLTQPTVSNALSRLRQTYEDKLFVRTPSGMMPTPVADCVIADIRQALQLLSKSVGANARFTPLTSEKNYRLGMNDLAQAFFLPKIQNIISQIAPNVSISCYYIDRQTATEELKSGDLDLLLDTQLVNAKELKHSSLGKLPYVVAMNSHHPLVKEDLTLEKYLSVGHIHVSSRKKGRGQVDTALHSLGYQRKIMMRVQNYLVAEKLTESTNLLWAVPKVLADTTNLITTKLPFEVESLDWTLYWHASAEEDPSNLWLRKIIANCVKN